MTELTGTSTASRSGSVVEATEPGDPADPGQRGRLVLAQRAVEHLARQAATEVDGVAVLGTGIAGRHYPHVAVQLAGHRARIQVSVATVWPAVLAQVAAAVAAHVRERLDALAGVRADSVDVRISKVVRPAESTRRRVS